MHKIIQARLAAANTRGDYKTALLKELLTLAEQGEAAAQFNLGEIYDSGHGVTQDYVRAHMWANLAFANGLEGAKDLSDILEAEMTPADISKAQEMARECLESGYKNCG